MKVTFLLTSALLLLFFSCKKENVDEDVANPEVAEISSFPIKTGNMWVYAVYDSLTQSSVVVPVKIVGTKTLHNGENVAIRVTERGSFDDTSYIAVDHDTVKIYTPEYFDGTSWSVFEKLRLIFPVENNQQWQINYLLDSAFVQGTEDMEVPAGNFPQCHKVKITQFGVERKGDQYIWLSDSVGLVYEWEDSYGMAPWIGTTWKLISYHIN